MTSLCGFVICVSLSSHGTACSIRCFSRRAIAVTLVTGNQRTANRTTSETNMRIPLRIDSRVHALVSAVGEQGLAESIPSIAAAAGTVGGAEEGAKGYHFAVWLWWALRAIGAMEQEEVGGGEGGEGERGGEGEVPIPCYGKSTFQSRSRDSCGDAMRQGKLLVVVSACIWPAIASPGMPRCGVTTAVNGQWPIFSGQWSPRATATFLFVHRQ